MTTPVNQSQIIQNAISAQFTVTAESPDSFRITSPFTGQDNNFICLLATKQPNGSWTLSDGGEVHAVFSEPVLAVLRTYDMTITELGYTNHNTSDKYLGLAIMITLQAFIELDQAEKQT
jgi:hypothetical protein